MKRTLSIFSLLLICFGLSAQMVHYEFYDTIRYTDGSFVSPNTVLNDISDDGKMIGYFEDDDGYNAGLLVLPNGKMSSFEYFGYNNTEITGINDAGYVLGKAYNSTNAVVVFQASIVGDIIDQAVELTWNGIGPSSKNSGKLNDDNVASGTVRITTQNWLHYESIIAPFTVAGSERYATNNPSFVSYNTYGLGHNNFEKYTGWYLDGQLRTPFVYDGISDAFFPQAHYPSGALQLRTYLNDINDNGYMAVSYVNSSVKFQGTIASYNGASTTYDGSFPLTSFENFEFFGINNNNDMVGYYENQIGQKVGLYALTKGPGLISFDPALHGFGFGNDSVIFQYPANVFNYVETDPYWSVQDSFYTNHITTIPFSLDADQTNSIINGQRFPSWGAFVLCRADSLSYLTKSDGTKIPRQDAIVKWLRSSDNYFQGVCFGMSVLALQNLSNPNLLGNRYGGLFTPQQNMIDYGASSTILREIIAALQLHTEGNQFQDIYQTQQAMNIAYDAGNWSGLEDLMRPNMEKVIDGLKQNNPDSTHILSISASVGVDSFYHAIMPFKITRNMDLSTQSDTIHCIDPSYPGSILKIFVDYTGGNSAGYYNDTMHYNIKFIQHHGNLGQITPQNDATFSEAIDPTNPKSISPPSTFIEVGSLCDFDVENMAMPSEVLAVQQGKLTGSWPSIGTFYTMDSDDKLDKLMGQGSLHTKTSIQACNSRNYYSYSYEEGTMIFAREGVLNGEVDIIENNANVMGISNPDNISKEMSFAAIHAGVNSETMIAIEGYSLGQNEELTLETIDANHFFLTNDEDDDKDYSLVVHYVDEEDLIDVNFENIPINVETSHLIVIQPEVENAQVIILVDENQDGTVNDTLFGSVQEPVGINDQHHLESLNVFPNPAQNILNVNLKYNKQVILSYSLDNIFGQVVDADKLLSIHQNDFQLDVSSIAPGIYFLNIKNENGAIIGKRKVVIH